jgi:hypothetical protein
MTNAKQSTQRRESGVALVLVLIFLSLMLVLGLGVTMTGITEVSVGANEKLAAEAFDTADAGSIHAYELIRAMKGDFTALLRGYDGKLKSGDEFQDWPGAVPLFNTSGVATSTTVPKMFDDTKVNRISKQLCADSKYRSLVRMDGRHFYELIAYDNGNDPYAKITPSAFEINNEPDVSSEVMTGGGNTGNPTADVDRRVLIRSIGYVMNRDTVIGDFNPTNAVASSTVDIVLGMSPLPAVVTNSDLTIGNSSDVAGALGAIHANDDLIAQNAGNWSVSQSATWTNSDNVTPGVSGGEAVNPTSSSHISGFTGTSGFINLPDLNPFKYVNHPTEPLSSSDVIFISSDTGIDNSSKPIHAEREVLFAMYPTLQAAVIGATTGTHYNGHIDHNYVVINNGGTFTATDLGGGNQSWTGTGAYSGLAVSLKGTGDAVLDTIPNPTSSQTPRTLFYLGRPGAGKTISFNGGTGTATIVTNVSVYLNGNFSMNPDLILTPDTQPPWDRANVLILAGEDVKGNGNPGSTFTGVIYGHEQFYFSGNASFTGQIIGYEAAFAYSSSTLTTSTSSKSASDYVDAYDSELTGNFTVTLNSLNGFLGNYSQIGWRQLRDYSETYARPSTVTNAYP